MHFINIVSLWAYIYLHLNIDYEVRLYRVI